MQDVQHDLEAVSRTLQDLHRQVLDAEGQLRPGLKGLPLLDRLLNDPAWAWLRALSGLITDLDEALGEKDVVSAGDAAAAAKRVRALVFGIGEPKNDAFLARYRPLLQESAALASAHGTLKRQVDALPS